MNTPERGGNAFAGAGGSMSEPGMSLRDYFAAAALTGLASIKIESPQPLPAGADLFVAKATAAYKYADAMLKARK